MKAEVLHCSFSVHQQPFEVPYTASLTSYLLRFQTQGKCKSLIDGKLTPIQSGTLLLYKSGDPYQLVIDEEDLMHGQGRIASNDYYLFCRGSWVDTWWQKNNPSQLMKIDSDEQLLSLWRMLIIEKRGMQEMSGEITDYMLRALLLHIERAISEKKQLTNHAFVAWRMKNFIHEHATTSFKIEDVAKHVDLSVSRAVHLFKACYGKTIVQYTIAVRLALAEEQIKYSSLTLEQIAELCGFGSYSYFYRVFRQQYGLSPALYREQALMRSSL